jgi:hypothetical protein
MKTVTLEMSAPVVLAGPVLCSVNAKTSWFVIPPPLLIQFSVVLPACVIVGNVAICCSSSGHPLSRPPRRVGLPYVE